MQLYTASNLRGAFKLMVDLGMRQNNLFYTPVLAGANDIRQQNGIWFPHLRQTKSGFDHDQALPDWAGVVIARWNGARRILEPVAGQKLFVLWSAKAGRYRAFSDSTLYRTFKRHAKICGLSCTPHDARAWAITELLASGVDLDGVRRFARHAGFASLVAYDRRAHGVADGAGRGLERPKI